MKQKRNLKRHSQTRRFLLRLGLLAAAGFLLRIVVSAQLIQADSFVFHPPPETDIATYHSLSDAICAGSFPDFFYYQPFYYSVFLPVAKILFQSRLWGPAILQSLCGAGIIYFAGLTAAQLRGRRAGLCAGILAAFSLMTVLYVPYALLEIPQCFHFTLLAYLTLRAMRRNTVPLWSAAGLVLAVSILSRGNAWCFLPALALAFGFTVKKFHMKWKSALLRACVFLLCLLLPQLPFVLRNTMHFGKFTGPSSAGPAVLALGNTPESPPGGLEYPETYQLWMDRQEERSVPGRILDFARKEPCAFLELQFRKFLLFWDSEDIPNNISFEINGRKSAFLNAIPLLPSGLILMLAAAAFLYFPKSAFRKPRLLVFLLFPLLYALATAAFYLLARFRVPAFGLLCVSGGLFLSLFFKHFDKQTVFGKMLRPGMALLLAAVLVYAAYPVYALAYEPGIYRILRPDGGRMDRSATETDVYDYGPSLPLGWGALPLTKGVEVEKTFRIPEEFAGAEGTLELHCFALEKSFVQLQLNGGEPKTEEIPAPERGKSFRMHEISFPVSGISTTGTARIRVLSGSPGAEAVSLFMDPRRDYGRTRVDGKTMPYEAVMRLKLKRK